MRQAGQTNASGYGSVRPPAPWGPRDILKALGLAVLLAVLLMIPAGLVADRLAGDNDIEKDQQSLAVLLIGNMLLELVLLLVALRLSVQKYRMSLTALGLHWPQRGGVWLPLVILVSAYVALGVYYRVLSAVGADDLLPNSTIPEDAFQSPGVAALTALLAIGLAPIVEETFFRGFIFGSLRWRWGAPLAALATGLLFSSLHFDLGSIIPFTIIGMLFAFSYHYSGSLFAAIASHFMFNTIAVAGSIIRANA